MWDPQQGQSLSQGWRMTPLWSVCRDTPGAPPLLDLGTPRPHCNHPMGISGISPHPPLNSTHLGCPLQNGVTACCNLHPPHPPSGSQDREATSGGRRGGVTNPSASPGPDLQAQRWHRTPSRVHHPPPPPPLPPQHSLSLPAPPWHRTEEGMAAPIHKDTPPNPPSRPQTSPRRHQQGGPPPLPVPLIPTPPAAAAAGALSTALRPPALNPPAPPARGGRSPRSRSQTKGTRWRGGGEGGIEAGRYYYYNI